MVDINDLQNVGGMISERQSIDAALKAIDDGARIASMILSGPNTTPPNAQFWVDTRNLEYPDQMVSAIKSSLEDQRQKLSDKLAELGVTGVDLPLRDAPSARTTVPPQRGVHT